MLTTIDDLSRRFVGVSAWFALLVPAVLAALGVVVGLSLPKFEAIGMLQFPEEQKLVENKPNEQKPPPDPTTRDVTYNVIELAAYKRVAGSYNSSPQLLAYFEAAGLRGKPAAERLLKQSESPAFWNKVAAPVLPFSRRDQKEFGDIKNASVTTMLGLELSTDARTGEMAEQMLGIIAGYYTSALIRERVRAWVLAGKVDAQSQEKAIQADILRAELDINLYGRRAEDMKVILARYPDATRMDSRQIVSVNPKEGGERYLSPLAQLVGAESAISQRHELIRRWQRELKQKPVLAQLYDAAEGLVDREFEVRKLLRELKALSAKTFAHADSEQEWSREAALRANAMLDNFEVMLSQIGIRNGVSVQPVPSRDPLRLASLGALSGVLLLGLLAFLRGSVLSMRRERETLADLD